MKQNEKSNKLVWFFLVIVVPAIFAVTVFTVVLSFMGVNVVDEFKKLPVVESVFNEDSEQKTAVTKEEPDPQLESKMNEQEDYIKMLNADLQKKEKEVVTLKGDIAILKKQVEDADSEKETKSNDQLKKLYEAMSAKDAAAVMTEMDNTEALSVLTLLQPEAQAEILAKLDAKRAAELTMMMADQS